MNYPRESSPSSREAELDGLRGHGGPGCGARPAHHQDGTRLGAPHLPAKAGTMKGVQVSEVCAHRGGPCAERRRPPSFTSETASAAHHSTFYQKYVLKCAFSEASAGPLRARITRRAVKTARRPRPGASDSEAGPGGAWEPA